MRLHELVIRAAERSPEATAVVAPDATLSYAELDHAAECVAHELDARGIGPGDRVGIWLSKSAYGVAAMQGVLRLGAAYVPLDPQSPTSRIAGIISDCALALVVTNEPRGRELTRGDCAEVPRLLVETIDWQATHQPAPRTKAADGQVDACGDDLAYVLYTSGSTGKPKGVCISHRNALAFVEWAVHAIEARRSDRFSNHAPFHFDLSVLDLYAAFSVGAAVCLIPESIAYLPGKLVRFVQQQAITVWYSVPSALILMMEHGSFLDVVGPEGDGRGATLRTVIFAGEPFPMKQLRRLRDGMPEAKLWNFYGPTETNVCTAYEVSTLPEEWSSLPIGDAASGDEVWVRRADGSRAEAGEIGELIVRGPTVMLGYWGRSPHAGPYPTGDLVREGAWGFEYIGRRDQMVKLRGHRVELGDIEAAIAQHPEVRQVAVVIDGQGLSAKLVACVVPELGREPGLLELKRHCAERLPRYMIVDQVNLVSQLPRTGNGKLDRRGLVQRLHSPRL